MSDRGHQVVLGCLREPGTEHRVGRVVRRITLAADEPIGLEAQWRAYAVRDTASAKLWMDAYLAAFAFTGVHRMVTTDAGFGRFDRLDLMLLR